MFVFTKNNVKQFSFVIKLIICRSEWHGHPMLTYVTFWSAQLTVHHWNDYPSEL